MQPLQPVNHVFRARVLKPFQGSIPETNFGNPLNCGLHKSIPSRQASKQFAANCPELLAYRNSYIAPTTLNWLCSRDILYFIINGNFRFGVNLRMVFPDCFWVYFPIYPVSVQVYRTVTRKSLGSDDMEKPMEHISASHKCKQETSSRGQASRKSSHVPGEVETLPTNETKICSNNFLK